MQLDPSFYPLLIPEPVSEFIIPVAAVGAPPPNPLVFSLVVPTFNEAQNLEPLVKVLATLLDTALGSNYEIIVVDDDSPDDTWKLAQSLRGDYPQLQVMRRQRERGLASAVVRGWQVARGEILGVIDGDLQHPPPTLLALLAAVQSGADLAVASRHVEGGGVSDWGLVRRFLSRGAQVLGLLVLPSVVGRVSDPMSGFFLVRRRCLLERRLQPVGYKILLEVLATAKIQKIAEVGYVFQERTQGKSKVTGQQYLQYLSQLIDLRIRRGWLGKLRPQLPVGRFLHFGLVGLSGVAVDLGVFYLLSDPSTLGWGLTRSKAIAAQVAMINNFLWNDRFTFGDLARRQPGTIARLRRFLKFNLICLAGLALNILTLNFLFHVLGVNRYLANLIAIALVTIWNFWLNLKLGWRVTGGQPPPG